MDSIETATVSVLDFGAAPNRGDDASGAFQAAIDHAAEVRRVILDGKLVLVTAQVSVPAGEFVLGSPIELRSGVSLVGESLGSTGIRHEGRGPCIDLTGREEKFNTSVANIAFTGSAESGACYDAVHANRGVIIQNCFFTGFDSAIRFYDCYTPCIRDCVIWNNREDGIQILDGHNVTLLNNRVENSGRHGIYVTHTPTNAPTAITFYGNVCQGNRAAGYCFDGVSQLYMGGNFAEGNNRGDDGWGAVHITTSEGVRNHILTINGMYITAGYTSPAGSKGIVVEHAQQVSFRDVLVRANGKLACGIEIGAGVAVAVVDNCAFLGVEEGIHVASDRTTVQYSPPRSWDRRHGKVFQGTGLESDSSTSPELECLQLHAGRKGAGAVGMGSYDGQPAIQGYGTGTGYAIRLNPLRGNVAIGDVQPSARLDVDGGARFRAGDVLVDGGWSSGRLRFGSTYLWVDGDNRLRMKHGTPTSDTDGTVVATANGVVPTRDADGVVRFGDVAADRIRLGRNWLWVDADGRLRMDDRKPTRDDAGSIVETRPAWWRRLSRFRRRLRRTRGGR